MYTFHIQPIIDGTICTWCVWFTRRAQSSHTLLLSPYPIPWSVLDVLCHKEHTCNNYLHKKWFHNNSIAAKPCLLCICLWIFRHRRHQQHYCTHKALNDQHTTAETVVTKSIILYKDISDYARIENVHSPILTHVTFMLNVCEWNNAMIPFSHIFVEEV